MRQNDLRRAAGLLALPLAAAVSVVEPIAGWGMAFPEDPAARIAEIAARPDDARTIAYSFLVSQLLFLVGALALMASIRARGAALATAGGVLLALGAFGHIVLGGANLVAAKMGAPAADPAEMSALYARAFDGGPVLPFMMLGLLGFLFGFIVLLVAAWRSGAFPRGAIALSAAALVAEFGLGAWEGGALVARVLFTGALAWLVWPALRSPGAPAPSSSG